MRLLNFGSFLEIAEVHTLRNFGLLFPRYLAKMGWATVWAIFSQNSSGRPV
jgi:hypothetical protein